MNDKFNDLKENLIIASLIKHQDTLEPEEAYCIVGDERFSRTLDQMNEFLDDYFDSYDKVSKLILEPQKLDLADEIEDEFGELLEDAITNYYMEHDPFVVDDEER